SFVRKPAPPERRAPDRWSGKQPTQSSRATMRWRYDSTSSSRAPTPNEPRFARRRASCATRSPPADPRGNHVMRRLALLATFLLAPGWAWAGAPVGQAEPGLLALRQQLRSDSIAGAIRVRDLPSYDFDISLEPETSSFVLKERVDLTVTDPTFND